MARKLNTKDVDALRRAWNILVDVFGEAALLTTVAILICVVIRILTGG